MAFFETLRKYSTVGYKKLENGTELIGKTPHIGSQAWLHIIFPGITETEISQYERNNQIHIPDTYKKFLKKANGIDIFSSSLYLFGIRSGYNRSGDLWQPFDLRVPNTIVRSDKYSDDLFIIGGYKSGDGYYLCLNQKTDVVSFTPRKKYINLKDWATIDILLEEEILRLSSLFDERGKRIGTSQETVPLKESKR